MNTMHHTTLSVCCYIHICRLCAWYKQWCVSIMMRIDLTRNVINIKYAFYYILHPFRFIFYNLLTFRFLISTRTKCCVTKYDHEIYLFFKYKIIVCIFGFIVFFIDLEALCPTKKQKGEVIFHSYTHNGRWKLPHWGTAAASCVPVVKLSNFHIIIIINPLHLT